MYRIYSFILAEIKFRTDNKEKERRNILSETRCINDAVKKEKNAEVKNDVVVKPEQKQGSDRGAG